MARSVLARIALETGRPAEGLRESDPSLWAAAGTAFEREALDRYTHAELLSAAGQTEEALAWYGSMAQRAAYELVYLAPAHLRQGQLLERLGRPEQAGSRYRTFVGLWRNADPELQPLVAEARRRAERLGTASAAPGGDAGLAAGAGAGGIAWVGSDSLRRGGPRRVTGPPTAHPVLRSP